MFFKCRGPSPMVAALLALLLCAKLSETAAADSQVRMGQVGGHFKHLACSTAARPAGGGRPTQRASSSQTASRSRCGAPAASARRDLARTELRRRGPRAERAAPQRKRANAAPRARRLQRPTRRRIRAARAASSRMTLWPNCAGQTVKPARWSWASARAPSPATTASACL